MPMRASSSARSFSAWPAWPLTQRQSISCARARLVEALPQLGVLHRLLVGGPPAVPLPAVDPGGDAVLHVLAVGVQLDAARPLQRFERRDRRHQLHAVVGGRRLRRRRSPCGVAVAQDRAPAAGAGIARAGAVGVDRPPVPARSSRGLARARTRAIERTPCGSAGGARIPAGPWGCTSASLARVQPVVERASAGSAAPRPRASIGIASRSAGVSGRTSS